MGEKRTPNIWYDDTMTLSNDTLKGMVNLQGFVHSFCMRSCVCLCVCTTDSTVQYIQYYKKKDPKHKTDVVFCTTPLLFSMLLLLSFIQSFIHLAEKESLAEDTLPLVLEGVDYIPYQKHSSELKIGKMSLIKKYRITVGSLAINRWKENPP